MQQVGALHKTTPTLRQNAATITLSSVLGRQTVHQSAGDSVSHGDKFVYRGTPKKQKKDALCHHHTELQTKSVLERTCVGEPTPLHRAADDTY